MGSINENLSATETYPFNQYEHNSFYYYNLFAFCFFLIWFGYLLLGIYQFVVMGTASQWYFRDLHIDPECRRKGQKRLSNEINYSSKYVVL